MHTNTFASFAVSVQVRAAITQALLERYVAYKFQCARMYEGNKHNKTLTPEIYSMREVINSSVRNQLRLVIGSRQFLFLYDGIF